MRILVKMMDYPPHSYYCWWLGLLGPNPDSGQAAPRRSREEKREPGMMVGGILQPD